MNPTFIILGTATILLLSFAFALRALKERLSSQTTTEPVEDGILLAIQVPKENEKGPLAAEMMFSALHGLLEQAENQLAPGGTQITPHLSLEMAASREGIKFYVYLPQKFRDFVQSQIYAQYPEAEIKAVEDYTPVAREVPATAATEVILSRPYYFPIKTFPDFEVDPLAAITSSVEDLKPNEQVWFQMLIKPLADIWQAPGQEYIEQVRTGYTADTRSFTRMIAENMISVVKTLAGDILGGLIHGDVQSQIVAAAPRGPERPPTIMPEQRAVLEAVQKKLSSLGYEVSMRAVALSETTQAAQSRLDALVSSLKQFTEVNLNGFERSDFPKEPGQVIADYQARALPGELENRFVLNTIELASVFHLPNISVETPNIAWTLAKKSEPPLNLPIRAKNKFAKTLFRNKEVAFGIEKNDRRRHLYIIGKTGTGKSTLMQNMIINDIKNGEGVAYFDPHGDAVDYILNHIPDERIDDVVLLDPGDYNHPVAINMLELFDPNQRGLVASSLVEVFRARFAFSWGPRLEHLLRNVFLSLLEVPGTTLLGVTRILIDRAYERYIVNLLEDPMTIDFWNNEFRQMRANPRLMTEAIAPVQNRLGPFLATPTIRNIIGHARSTVRLDEIMNEGKILLVNLSKGKIGEDNMAILGSMLVSRLEFAAMTRVSVAEEQRRDFYLYVDEFQNFATTSFASILSEARKYRLNLTMAHQYIAQVPEEIRDAVFGNVGSMICFTIGQVDARVVAKEFEPVFDENDLINLEKFQVYLKLMIDLAQSRPFSAVTLPPQAEPTYSREKAIAAARAKYARPRELVEERIKRWSEKQFTPGMDDKEVKRLKDELKQKAMQAESVVSAGETPESSENEEVKGEIKLEKA